MTRISSVIMVAMTQWIQFSSSSSSWVEFGEGKERERIWETMGVGLGRHGWVVRVRCVLLSGKEYEIDRVYFHSGILLL